MKELEGWKRGLGILVCGANYGAVVSLLYMWIYALLFGNNGMTILWVNRYGEGWFEVWLLVCLVMGNLWLLREWRRA